MMKEKRKREGGSRRESGRRAKKRNEVRVNAPFLHSWLFPGDMEVNGDIGERVKYAPVEKVVEAITRVPPDIRVMSVRLVHH